MPLDAKALTRALQLKTPVVVHQELCRHQATAFEAGLKQGGEVLVACTQEAPLFNELAQQIDPNAEISFVNIREQAGWSADADKATPKIAALIAAASLPEPEPVPSVSYKSAGQLLIIGPSSAALSWAEQLFEQRDVSVLLTDIKGGHELPVRRDYPVYSGKVEALKGYLGAFEVSWSQVNPIDLETCTRCNACIEVCPEHAIDYSYQIDLDKCKAHRKCVAACGEIRAIDFERRDTVRSDSFDLILDLSDAPLFTMQQPPQGYFAPGRDPLKLARAVAQLAQMTGEFEKPKFFTYKESICAHSRAEITGCTKCIDICSTRAIFPDGDHVKVEPHLCMGCGACASVCPSGAMGYAYPRVADLGARIKTLLQTYLNAGGEDPCLLLHNATDGRELIAKLGRRGKGLPANVIPLETFHVASLGMDVMLGTVALGASGLMVLSTGSEAPQYKVSLQTQMGFAEEILQEQGYKGEHFQLIEATEVAALEQAIWGFKPAQAVKPATFNLSNEKRTTLDFAFDHLAKNAPVPRDEIPLSDGAPYGKIDVNKDTCTLCMACVGACPEKALLDSKEVPQLKFIERNCVQCGLCEKTCPEQAINLTPRLLLTKEARSSRILNEAEVFACIRCGKPFATKQMINNMLGKLGTHSMFSGGAALTRLQMCADCRVVDMMKNKDELTIFDVRS
ncbi:MAG TPA: 4Fe-4S binding protein [Burkholderiales bacterium]|nr:4Fe-4S binding protein [Burkholderiales bacterium]